MSFWTSKRIRDWLIFSYIFVLFWPLYVGSGVFETEYLYPKISVLDWLLFELGFTALCVIAYIHGTHFNPGDPQWR